MANDVHIMKRSSGGFLYAYCGFMGAKRKSSWPFFFWGSCHKCKRLYKAEQKAKRMNGN